MITVTNRIKVKKGMAMMMAPKFAEPGPLQQFEGFEKVEVLVSTQFEDYDEMNVVMYWDTKEHFAAWRESDAFKDAHKRPSGDHGAQGESPLLGSEIIISEVAAAISK
ncbi:heme oxygenase [Lysinibacillus sp. 2017]|uniref:heme oxygenase n=1 Tax=unclassified Lysinibacillus TaxID=2636778 RepID=UPI000D52A133|nr:MULTISPECIES: heme oxygenase [unclassified Lysinibacillus]AWE06851.1 heme oxygenase [Lysinibacillus sp. 2017]TGN37218.1 heme oxygenase [Lysinibacillus sp. S2017]